MRAVRSSVVSVFLVGLASACVGALPASAQSAPDAKPRKPAAKFVQVQVLNQRDATLVELSLLGRTKGAQPVVIASGIGPGGKMTGRVPAKAGCVFSVTGTFDDESTLEVAAVNLCKDPRITLVE